MPVAQFGQAAAQYAAPQAYSQSYGDADLKNRLFVGGLPNYFTKDELADLFRPYGVVTGGLLSIQGL
jgi:hypothetical protein